MTTQRLPWTIIIALAVLWSCWLVGAFDAPESPKQSSSDTSTKVPAVSAPAAVPRELTPEQKAEQAAKKAKEDIENAKFYRDVAVVRQLKASMKNPASFELEEAIRMDDGTLCISYRARNSFNAVIPGEAVITKDRIYTTDKRSSFVAQYNKLCANKSGRNMRHIRVVL
jgi:hypothetical protein